MLDVMELVGVTVVTAPPTLLTQQMTPESDTGKKIRECVCKYA